MPGELVEFDEGTLIHQPLDALARGHLALRVLLVDTALSTRGRSGLPALGEVGQFARGRGQIRGRFSRLGAHGLYGSNVNSDLIHRGDRRLCPNRLADAASCRAYRVDERGPGGRCRPRAIAGGAGTDCRAGSSGPFVDQPARGRIDLLGALDVPATVQAWGWIPLLAGVAVADAVRAAGVNDVGSVAQRCGRRRRQTGGILSVRDEASAIVGIGLNLRFAGARPDPDAVSVAQAGGDPDPDRMLAAVVSNLHGWWTRFVEAAGDAHRCGLHTALHRAVHHAGSGGRRRGDRPSMARDCAGIDAQGRLLVRDDAGMHAVSAADVSLRA